MINDDPPRTAPMKMLEIDFAHHRFALLPDRAAWWPAARTVIVADVHVGKAATFRAFGVPVPSGLTAKDLSRLSILIEHFNASRLLILGDLLHSREARASVAQLKQWRDRHANIAVQLVGGNHDRSAGIDSETFGIHSHCGILHEQGLDFVHEPADTPRHPTLAGHVHPTMRLNDFDGSGVRVPCFVVDPLQMIFPSFGSFTGGHQMNPLPDRRLIAVAAGRVVEMKGFG
jgi:DNA ligase-associated metallophosphoesterase